MSKNTRRSLYEVAQQLEGTTRRRSLFENESPDQISQNQRVLAEWNLRWGSMIPEDYVNTVRYPQEYLNNIRDENVQLQARAIASVDNADQDKHELAATTILEECDISAARKSYLQEIDASIASCRDLVEHSNTDKKLEVLEDKTESLFEHIIKNDELMKKLLRLRQHNHPHLTDLENRDIYGKCNHINGHGHNYEIIVTLYGDIHPKTGMLMNMTELKTYMEQAIMATMDHKNLDKDIEFFKDNVSTTEMVAVYCWKQMQLVMSEPNLLYEIEIHETENNIVRYRGGN